MARQRFASRRAERFAPFTAAEDAELARMVGCGLDCNYYAVGLPGRPFGQILARRLQLIKAGRIERAPAI